MRLDRALLLAGAGGAFGSLDSALNIAFPDLVDGLGIEVGDLQWVVVSFVLSYGGLLLAAGQLGDTIGHRRMLTIGAAGSVIAMVGCAVAPNFTIFLVARVLQGITTAMVMAAAPALATLAAGGTHRGRAVGVFQMAAGVGGAIGPVVGGPLVDLGGWPAVFWFRVPVALALLWLALTVTADKPGAKTGADVNGAVMTSLVLAGALLAVNSGRSLGWTSPLLLLVVAGALILAGAYTRRAMRHPAPIVDLRMFGDPSFAIANFLTMASNGAMFVAWLLVPALVVNEMDAGVFVGGLVLAASPAAMSAASPIAGRWSDRSGPHMPVAVGLIVETIGLVLLSNASADWHPAGVAGALAVIGLGLGLFGAPNMALVMSALPDDRQGVAGGLSLMMRTTGIVIGVTASSALFDAFEPKRGFVSAFQMTTWASAAAAALAAVFALRAFQLKLRARP